jgi:hypothetical protein
MAVMTSTKKATTLRWLVRNRRLKVRIKAARKNARPLNAEASFPRLVN